MHLAVIIFYFSSDLTMKTEIYDNEEKISLTDKTMEVKARK